jgi:hypothetical protein
MKDISRRHLITAAAGLAATAAGATSAASPIRLAKVGRPGPAQTHVRDRFALAPDVLHVNAANLCPTFASAIEAEKAESAALGRVRPARSPPVFRG